MKQSSQIHKFIQQLLLAWKATGHHVGVDTHLRLQEIIKKIPNDINPSKFKTLLAPILAENKNQQQELYGLIDKFVVLLPKPRPLWQRLILVVPQIIFLAIFIFIFYNKYHLSQGSKRKISPYIFTKVEVGKTKPDSINRILVAQTNQVFQSLVSINSVSVNHAKVEIIPNSKHGNRFNVTGLTKGTDTIPITLAFLTDRTWSEISFRFNRENFITTQKTFFLVITVFDRITDLPKTSILPDSLAYKEYDHRPSINSLALEKIPLFSIKFAYWNWTKTGIFFGWIFLLLLLGYLLMLMRFKDQTPSTPDAAPLRKRPNDTPPYVLELEAPQVGQLSRGELITKVIARLNQRSNAAHFVLDVQGSIQTTIQQAGRIAFRYKSPSNPKEYLWLIDSPSPHDHRAQLFDSLYQDFRKNQVLIERFFFHRDVRLCWNEQFPDGISLLELQHRFGEHELFIIGHGDALISPSSGDLQEWAKIFEGWKSRSFLTTRATEQLDQEAQLLSTLFHLAPATLAGLSECFEATELLATDHPSSGKSSFSSVSFTPRLSEQLSPEAVFGALEAEFVEYYPGRTDDRLLKWVAACAISPVLHWDVTLFFGSLVDDYPEDPLLSYVNLEKLTQLDWFTSKGFIPENARKALLKWLEAEHIDLLLKLRLAWKDILEDNLARLQQAAKDLGEPPFENSVAYDDLRMAMIVNELTLDNLQQEKINPEERRQLERELRERKEEGHFDFLALELLAQADEEAGEIEDQSGVKKTLAASLGLLNNWWWQLLLVVVGLLGIWAFNANGYEACPGSSFEYRAIVGCLGSPQDSLTFFEQVVCDTMKNGNIPKSTADSIFFEKNLDANLTGNSFWTARKLLLDITHNNITVPDYYILISQELIRRHKLDSSSFYLNTGKAFWNTGAYHYNAGRIDSACIYFSKLEEWIWRDSVVTQAERDLIRRLCTSVSEVSTPVQREQINTTEASAAVSPEEEASNDEGVTITIPVFSFMRPGEVPRSFDTNAYKVFVKDSLRVAKTTYLPKPKSRAILFAVDKYHNSERLNLTYPIQHALQISNLLKNSYDFEVETIFNPTKTEFTQKLVNLMQSPIDTSEQLLIYISGHSDKQYFLPSDANPDKLPSSALNFDDLQKVIASIPNRNKLVMFDGCWAMGIKNSSDEITSSTSSALGLINFLFAGATAGGSAPDRSPFSQTLITALSDHKNKQFNGRNYADVILSFSELQYLWSRVSPKPFIINQPGLDFLFIPKQVK